MASGKFVFLVNSSLAHAASKSADIEFVKSREDFEGYFSAPQNQLPDGIIVTAELNWNQQHLTKFYGLELVKELRLNRQLKCPIVVTSYLPSSYFSPENKQFLHGNFRFFRDPSISYIPLIEIERTGLGAVKSVLSEPLDDELYEDLCENLYQTEGFIGEIFHEFGKEIRKRSGQLMETQLVKAFFERISILFPEFEEDIQAIFIEMMREFKGQELVGAELILDAFPRYQEMVEKVLPLNYQLPLLPMALAKPIEALYIDDERVFGDRVVKAMQKHHIKCHYAPDGQTAIDILKADTQNQITVVISDYRFLDANNRYQRDQGYHILKKISQLPNMVFMITLTGMDSLHLATMLQKQRPTMPMFKKDVFDSANGLERLCRYVKKLHAEVTKEMNKPTSFSDRMLELYKQHRAGIDYEMIEEDISKTAHMVVTELKKQGVVRHGVAFLPKVNGKLDNANEVRNKDNFQDLLLARRIVLGLCQFPDDRLKLGNYSKAVRLDRNERWALIYYALRHGALEMNPNKVPSSAEVNTVITRNLKFLQSKTYAWKASRSQTGLTIEEKIWLEKFSADFE